MGRFFMTLVLASLTSFFGIAQSLDAQYNSACICISKIDLGLKKTDQYKEATACVEKMVGKNNMLAKLKKAETNGLPARGEKYTIEDLLIGNCPAVRTLVKTSYDLSGVPSSVQKKAVKYYEEGLYSYRLTNYKSAQEALAKAIKKDPSVSMAWDLIGLSAEAQEDYRGAVRAYEKSIAENPFGRIALINKPKAHEKLGQYSKAIEGYQKYIRTYPKNPEGYYRIGAAYHQRDDYENALDNTMKSFRIFQDNSAPFLKEALRVITIIRNDLTEKNRLDIFKKYSEKYNLTVGN